MFIIGLMMTCFGIPFAILMFSALEKVNSNPYTYHYANGFNESTVSTLAILSVIIAVVGICLMIFGWMKRKNKSILDSIENQTSRNYCTNCSINVDANNGQCPLCGKKLRGNNQ